MYVPAARGGRVVSYRPICDVWWLARAKLTGGHKYYGAYLGGFPERARALLGVSIDDPVLHVCGGMARHYPYAGGFGLNDKTLDLDPLTEPDYLQDVRLPLPTGFKAMLADPPYSAEDAKHYRVGEASYPTPNQVMQAMLDSLLPGQRAGMIHYMIPGQPKRTKFIASIGVCCGFNNRIRAFTVFEKLAQ